MVVGYTAGVYDLFHIGHLNLFKNARAMCDKLVVGVTTDDLVTYKGKHAFIPFEDRIEIVRSCDYVDAAVPQYDMDKLAACKKLGASVLFVGDDWYGTEKWENYEQEFKKAGIKIVYFPYTKGISSTKITKTLHEARGWTSPETSRQFPNDIDISCKTYDLNYCMSSFLAFRYIEKENVDFFRGVQHKNALLPAKSEWQMVDSAKDIDAYLQKKFNMMDEKVGILLSGGMDSACLAAYMPKGSHAYTFRFEGGDYAADELERAKEFAKLNNLHLHYVDINWEDVIACVPALMARKGAPVHSIEPQIYLAARQAQADGVEKMVIGDAADYVFYGMDGLLAKDWEFDEFVNRSMYINPNDVLVEPVDVRYLYERYRRGRKIDFLGFYDKVVTEESYGSYENAFVVAGMPFVDPYENFHLARPLDLQRVRHGDSKYFIRDLFRWKYPNTRLPEKSPMPRPVDKYFENWQGPTRMEFKPDLDVSKYSGNQKWLLWCLEKFLDMYLPAR